jgi:hypothetical protein
VAEFAMIRNLDGRKLVFLRFHNANHVIVSESGAQRVLATSIWASSNMDWTVA